MQNAARGSGQKSAFSHQQRRGGEDCKMKIAEGKVGKELSAVSSQQGAAETRIGKCKLRNRGAVELSAVRYKLSAEGQRTM